MMQWMQSMMGIVLMVIILLLVIGLAVLLTWATSRVGRGESRQ